MTDDYYDDYDEFDDYDGYDDYDDDFPPNSCQNANMVGICICISKDSGIFPPANLLRMMLMLMRTCKARSTDPSKAPFILTWRTRLACLKIVIILIITIIVTTINMILKS